MHLDRKVYERIKIYIAFFGHCTLWKSFIKKQIFLSELIFQMFDLILRKETKKETFIYHLHKPREIP
jgi:hypothetical protein